MSKKLTPSQIETWRLFITAHAWLISLFEAEMAAAGQIPLHWYDVLIELHEAPERRLRMSELARRVILSRSGLTRLVDQLEKAGYLARAPDPDDRRGSYAVLTDAGADAMRRAWPVYARMIGSHFTDHLTDAEAEQLTRIFGRIIHELAAKDSAT